jgi:hypothetical protein
MQPEALERLSARSFFAASPNRAAVRAQGGELAVIGLYGVLFGRRNIYTELGIGTALSTVAAAIRDAARPRRAPVPS